MTTQRVKLQEWLPDQPSTSGALLQANNTVPLLDGYGPFPNAVDYSNDAGANLNNVYASKFERVIELFAGSNGALYKYNVGTQNLDDVSKSGGYNGSGRWRFAQFGQKLLAVDNNDKIQSWTADTSTNFADVSADAPVAKFITVVRDFVVVGDVGGVTNKVAWSDINDETNYTSGSTSQADYQIVPDGGDITGLTGGEFGLVFLERSIVRFSYIGSPLFFQFDTISRGLGCTVAGSVAQYGTVSYFLSDDGFYSCDGTSVKGIGAEKIDKYFFSHVDFGTIDSMSAAVDPVKNLIVWNYPKTSGGRGLIMYNFQNGRWATADTTSDYISSVTTAGVTLEDLDGFGLLDDLDTSLDSRLWTGGKLLFAGTEGQKIVTFTGSNSTAEFITGDLEFGYNSLVNLARPIVENGSSQVALASRKNLDDTITYGPFYTANSDGRIGIRNNGRWHRIKMRPSGSWLHAMAIDIDVVPRGNR